MRYRNRFLKVLSSVLYDLPAPVNLTIFWNFGSLLGVCLVMQIFTGLLMAVHYTPEVSQAFDSVVHIMRDVNGGWFLRSAHANGASFFFGCIYAHIGRGIFYHSFFMTHTWLVGCTLFVVLMAIATTGYVLPWGQMSFWGATVITNLWSAIPYVGPSLVEWLWGGFCVGDATLKRFFVFHFLAPFILMVLVGVHILFLHDTGSGNPLGIDSDAEAVPFHSYYVLKDLVGIVIMVGALCIVVFCEPDLFSDPTNFTPADPMKTPLHIQPEWYFLFAYTILRSIPNKLGGAMALAGSVLILYILPLYPKSLWRGSQYNPVAHFVFWAFVSNFIVLTYIGMCPVEPPFEFVGMVASVLYFLFYIIYPLTWFFWENMIFDSVYESTDMYGDNYKETNAAYFCSFYEDEYK
uniref:Cytochrome b n=1 Tax=Meretrix petechialis TaxID=311198 RepID=C5GZ83_9BIVA|nr:cytochrome b [Meretrix petechialis]ABV53326.1 cytochrome b [Meretrix petechialis]